ncbi:MAG: hypothetical protein ABL955_13940, partial [Elusimicrobiota bacterium]
MGSTDTADWKPALAYPPFKKALLESLEASVELPKAAQLPPMPAILPAAPAMPLPAPFPLPLPVLADSPKQAPVPKTIPCPRCAHANLEEAHFCNSCGAPMDGRLEDLSPKAPVDSPKASLPPPAPAPAPAPSPAFDSFAHLDPMLSYPTEPAPLALPESPRRPLQPGKMGQLGEIEETAPVASYAAPAPALAPELPPAAVAVPVWKRPAVLAAFFSAAVVTAGLAYVMLNKKALPETVAELTPSAQVPMPEPAPTPAPAQPLYSTPPPTSSPAMPAPRAPKKPAKMAAPVTTASPAVSAKPKRARKPRPARTPKPEAAVAQNDGAGETLIESTSPEPKPKASKGKRAAKASQGDKDPLLEALLTDATQPAAGSEAVTEPGVEAAEAPAGKAPPMIGQRAAANPSQFSMPGLQ